MVILNAGKQLLLDQAFGESSSPEDYVVDLYSNNHVPVDTDTAGAFTTAVFTGYAQVSVPRSSFGAATIVSNLAVLLSSVVPTFSCTGGGGQTVYGFYLRGASSGTAYLAQYFTGGRAITSGLSEVLYPFQIELGSL
jgi:hypothetical protein